MELPIVHLPELDAGALVPNLVAAVGFWEQSVQTKAVVLWTGSGLRGQVSEAGPARKEDALIC